MKPAKLADVIAAIGGELVQGNAEVEITGVSTDTRTVKPGDLFFAIVGETFDGHAFIHTAVEKGAAAVIISHPAEIEGTVIKVPDTLVALGDLAMWHRQRYNVRVVGITGSVGKTSTKEMVAAVLSSKFKVLKNAGNFNNEIGVPMTIFQLEPEHEILVQEMAMRLPGEIAELAEIAKPDIGVITNIGLSHIERLGTQDAIAAAKSELLESLPEEGIAVLNINDPYFGFLAQKASAGIISYGVDEGDVQAQCVSMDEGGHPSFDLVIGQLRKHVTLSVAGAHNVPNAAAAAAVGVSFGMTLDEVVEGLESIHPTDKRANVIEAHGYKVYDDTYNASPASMTSALHTIASMAGDRKIAVLGDMLELGDHAEAAHHYVGKIAGESGLDMLVTVGELSKHISEGARSAGRCNTHEFSNSEEAAAAMKAEAKPGDVILVKGSRGMKMEKVVEALK